MNRRSFLMTAALALLDPIQKLEAWQQQEAAKYRPKLVPPEIREQYARETTLRMFYDDCIRGRWDSLGRPGRKPDTYQKDRQALNRWERFTQPDDWRGGDWQGPTLSFLDIVGDEWLDKLWKQMGQEMAEATVKATRGHLLTIMRHAVTVRAISRHPAGERPKAEPRTRIYTPAEVQATLEAFEVEPELYTAFWLDLHLGPRSEDLFLLKWTNIIEDVRGRRLLDYEAIKTGKLQAVPIADCVWEVIDELLDKSDPYLFPHISNPNAADPEKSVEARMRNSLAKRLMKRAGINVPNKPWQVARATCNERYESHRLGVGQFILGHSAKGVNATSYRDPTAAVWEAVRTLPPYTRGLQRRLFG